MRSIRIAVLVGVMVGLGALPAAAQGALVLDQSQEDVTIGFIVGDQDPTDDFPRFTIAQTFTAGLSGPLGKVELYLSKVNTVEGDPRPLPITVEIRTVSGLIRRKPSGDRDHLRRRHSHRPSARVGARDVCRAGRGRCRNPIRDRRVYGQRL